MSQKLVIHNTYCSTCYKIIPNFILFHGLYHVFDCVDVNFVLLDSADGLLHDGDGEVGVEPEEGEGRAQHPHVLGVRTHCVHLDISIQQYQLNVLEKYFTFVNSTSEAKLLCLLAGSMQTSRGVVTELSLMKSWI